MMWPHGGLRSIIALNATDIRPLEVVFPYIRAILVLVVRVALIYLDYQMPR